MISLLRYLRFKLLQGRFPQFADYIDEGFGIAARARRARRYWAPHLRLAREFQVSSLASGGESLAILGAGRLLDVPGEFFASHFKRITLMDADAGSVASWRRFECAARREKTKIVANVLDITGCMAKWTSELDNFLAAAAVNEESLRDFLQTLSAPVEAHVPLAGFESVISLNLLSQIPLYWRERVLLRVRRFHCALAARDDRLKGVANDALEASMAELQRQHLAALGASGAKSVLVLTDVEFNYYQRDKAPWLSEPALYNGVQPLVSGYRERSRSGWLWHIAPQGIEQPDFGVIHRVQAGHFAR